MVPKQRVFSVQSSFGTSEVSGENTEHRRKGSLPPAFSLMSHAIDVAELVLPLPDSSSSSVQAQPRWKSALYWLCGMESRKDGDEGPAPSEENECSLEEKPHLRRVVDINLIICLCVAAFIVGYWA